MTTSKFFSFALLATTIALARGMAIEPTGAETIHLAKRGYADCLKAMFKSVLDSKPADADAAVCFSGNDYGITFQDRYSYQSAGSQDCYKKEGLIKHKNHYDCWYFLGVNDVKYNSDTGPDNLAQWFNGARCSFTYGTLSCFPS
ncbi:conserved hypothetical Ustilaginaceae-specific protein [Sporisorium reilianum SRZ2]|uniref:Conserved hypothetical Ustilaginaceae-specific protein n=1 Tax=Sporisorium reilianum (strain SRZ2) TaxID=999809 RepID=E7A117_SPORE|nr:conserved hypothetical Ustilaginaceae-specific protein [Sporisorium reilianum SRZ2]